MSDERPLDEQITQLYELMQACKEVGKAEGNAQVPSPGSSPKDA
jgi:hypothetical protein